VVGAEYMGEGPWVTAGRKVARMPSVQSNVDGNAMLEGSAEGSCPSGGSVPWSCQHVVVWRVRQLLQVYGWLHSNGAAALQGSRRVAVVP